MKWSAIPDYGYVFQSATGVNTVGGLTKPGRDAGLIIGDRFIKINGKPFSNIADFRSAIQKSEGRINRYIVERNGVQTEISIPNIALGFKNAFYRSGIPFLVGLCYIAIGVLVFLMKPHLNINWVFLLFCINLGLFFLFLNKVSKLNPGWFSTIEILIFSTVPAVFIHLSINFPEKWNIRKKIGILARAAIFSIHNFIYFPTICFTSHDGNSAKMVYSFPCLPFDCHYFFYFNLLLLLD